MSIMAITGQKNSRRSPSSAPGGSHRLPGRGSRHWLIVCLALWLLMVTPLHADEPVKIVITGIKGEALKNVQESLRLPASLVREGKVEKPWLNRFAQQAPERTRTALESFGYYNAQVTVKVEPARKKYRLLVRVAPGKPVILTDVRVSVAGPGNEEPALREMAVSFPLKKGDVLLHQKYETAKENLKSAAHDLGYLDAEFLRHEIRIPRAATTATIELHMETGEKYYFGPTSFQGGDDYPEHFLRRHLTYRVGETFSFVRLGETQNNFTNSERFKEVIVTPLKQKAEEFRVPVIVQMKATPRITLSPGIGYGTDTGARLTLKYRDLNMFHKGHEFYSHLFLAERLQGIATGYVMPSPKDIRSSTALLLNLQQEDNESYSSEILSLGVERTRSLGKGKLGAAYLTAQYEDYSVGNQKTTTHFLLPGLRFFNDRFDDPVRPRQGFRYNIHLRGTDEVLGSDMELIQIIAEGNYLVPLPWRLSLRTRAKTGTTFLSDSVREIPPSLRFFAGGDQSVRGYEYKSLGPRDASGDVVGGKQLLSGSIELERALFEDWGVSLFYDAGNAFDSFSSFSLFQGTGVTLHYYTRVGALNLSLARSVGVDDPSFRIHLTVGFEL